MPVTNVYNKQSRVYVQQLLSKNVQIFSQRKEVYFIENDMHSIQSIIKWKLKLWAETLFCGFIKTLMKTLEK